MGTIDYDTTWSGFESQYNDGIIIANALITLAQNLLGNPQEAGVRLCQGIATLTDNKARLHLHPFQHSHQNCAFCSTGIQAYSVSFDNWVYGTLSIDAHDEYPDIPAVSETVSLSIACISGSILYLLEQAAMIQSLSKSLPLEMPTHLTPRQDEVLRYMALGYDENATTEELQIELETLKKHRQAIFAKLGVHHQHEAILAAHRDHLFFYVAGTGSNTPD